MREQEQDPFIGTRLPGGHNILELIEVGGMGRVYRAEQAMLGRTVAVKVIHPHLLGNASAEARFAAASIPASAVAGTFRFCPVKGSGANDGFAHSRAMRSASVAAPPLSLLPSRWEQ